MPRLPDIVPDALTPAQKRVYDAILAGPRGRVEGPLRVWVNVPELAERAEALGAFCRFGTGLPARLSELAILVTGACWRAGFEWHVHAPIGLKAGLDLDVVAAVKARAAPRFARADEAAVHDFARELLDLREVTPATYARAEAELGRDGLVALVGILGYYGLISMTIKAFEVPVPPPDPDPFAL